jgi:hypothetical protein
MERKIESKMKEIDKNTQGWRDSSSKESNHDLCLVVFIVKCKRNN